MDESNNGSQLFKDVTVGWFIKISMILLLAGWLISTVIQGTYRHDFFTIWGQCLAAIGFLIHSAHFVILRRTNKSMVEPKQLVTTKGLYRSVRHPMYLGDFLLMMGLAFMIPHWGAPVLLLIGFFGIKMQCEYEDEKLAKIFGEDFTHWKEKTVLLLPRMY
jgi:protein-S-isoprenylcysteine O-methyltransferase Ste14